MKQQWIFAVCLLFVCTLTTQAQWSTDPAVNKFISTSDDPNYHQMVGDGEGGAFLLVSKEIVARVNANGQILWIQGGFGGNEIRMISDEAGGVIVTWIAQQSSTLSDVFAQRINGNGEKVWSNQGVPICTAAGDQLNPVLTSDGAGGAVITWEDDRQRSFAFYNIFAQKVNANGIVQWATDGVPISTAGGSQQAPAIVTDGNGGAIITWEDTRKSEQFDIYAQRINASGNVLWAIDGAQITNELDNQREPTLISDGAGGAIITWRDIRTYPSWSIFAQHLNASGGQQWGTNGTRISGVIGYHYAPRIASDGAGGAIISWLYSQNNSNFSTSWEVYAQRINSIGVIQWAINGVSFAPVNGQQSESPAIIADGAGGAILTWSSEQSSTSKDIFAQRINASGNAQWATNGVPISTANGLQLRPRLVSDDAGGTIISWTDYRNGTSVPDIYAQRVRSNGTLGGNLAPIANAGADQIVIAGEIVQLDGSASSDADGDRLTYSWELITKPVSSHASLSHPMVVNPNFVADAAGVYVASLKVNDGFVDSAPDVVVITALTPLDAAKALKQQVQVLIANGVLNKKGNGLLAQIDGVINKLAGGKITPARNQLRAFIHHVKSLIACGVLTPAQGQPLLDSANRILLALGG